MLKCWQHYPEHRPGFPELQKELDIMLTSQQKEEYIEINNVDEPYCQMYPAQEGDDQEENTNVQVSNHPVCIFISLFVCSIFVLHFCA